MKRLSVFLGLLIVLFGLIGCNFSPEPQADTLTIDFEPNGGDAVSSIEVDVGENATLPVIEREGYIFDGWYVSSAFVGSSITTFPAVTGGTVTLYAKWTPIVSSVTLTFEVNGGSSVADIETDPGDSITAPDAPTKVGHTFLGWYEDAALTTTFTFTTMPSESKTLYAKWQANDYTINFEVNGGTTVPALTAAYLNAISAPTAPTKTGYTFGGWYTDSGLTTAYTFTTMPLNGLTLYAKWEPALVNVTIEHYGKNLTDANYSLIETTTAQVLTGTIYTASATTLEGFGYDSTNENAVSTGTVLADGSLVLKLYYTRDTITVTFNTTGGSLIDPLSGLYQADIVEPTDPTRDGYTFDGWYLEDSFTTAFDTWTYEAEDFTLYAKWSPLLVTVTVEHYRADLDGLSYTLIETETLEGYTGSTYEADRKTYTGFFYDSENTLNIASGTVLADGSLRLKIYYDRHHVSMSFNTYGGTSIDPISGLFETNIVLPANPTFEGYTFEGWFLDETYLIPFDLLTYPEDDFTLHAKWQPEIYNVDFIVIDGMPVKAIKVAYGETLELPDPTRLGYTFNGWYIDETLETLFEGTTMPLGDLTLYGTWTRNTYTIYYREIDGTLIGETDYLYNASVTPISDPEKVDYIFVGWYEDVEFSTLYNFGYMPAEDVTVYARFEEASFAETLYYFLTQEEGTIGNVVGTIYATFDDGHPGYFIYDETAMVFVEGDTTGLTLGDTIEISVMLQLLNDGTSLLHPQDNATILASDQPLLDGLPIPLETLDDAIIYGVYTSTGILIQEGNDYYLVDMVELEGYKINRESYNSTRQSELDAALYHYTTLTYVLMVINDQYELLLIDLTSTPLTDTQIFDMIETLALNYFTNALYYPFETIDIPETDPFGFTNISFKAVGENAIYFDEETQTFLEVEETTTLEFEITIEIILTASTHTFSVFVNVEPITIQTIQDVLNGENGTYYQIYGWVVAQFDYGLILLKDETGVLAIENPGFLQIGDEVILTVRRSQWGNEASLVFIYANDQGVVVERLISQGKELAKTPIPMTLEEILALDPNDPSIYGTYIETRAFLVPDYFGYHSFEFLRDGELSLPIESYSHNGFEKIMEYYYLEVYIRGYIFVNHMGELTFMYEGIRQDIRIPDYTDQERVDVIAKIMEYYYRDTYNVFDYFPMMPYHPDLGGTITWTTDANFEHVYNPQTQRFNPIFEPLTSTLTATITSGLESRNVTFTFTVEAATLSTPSSILENTPYGMHFIQGYVTYWHPNYLYLTDEFGATLYLEMSLPEVRKGDEIIVYGGFGTRYNNSVYIYAPWNMEPLIEILSRDNSITYTAFETNILDLYALDYTDIQGISQIVELTGRLNVVSGNVYIITPEGQVYIEAVDLYTLYQLEPYHNEIITIRGFLKTKDYSGNLQLRFTNQPGDLALVETTDIEKADIIEAYILEHYQQPIIGDSYFMFNQANVIFNKGTIAFEAVDDTDNVLSIHTNHINGVDVLTEIEVAVTITMNDVVRTFSITMTIIPEEEKTYVNIEDLILDPLLDGTISAMVISATRVEDGYFYLLLEDDTGHVFIKLSYADYRNKYYLLTPGVIIEVTGRVDTVNNRLEILYDSWEAVDRYTYTASAEFYHFPLNEINEFDITDTAYYGLPVQLEGTIEMVEIDYVRHFYIVEGDQRVLITMTDTNYTMLNDYVGYRVVLQGFIFGHNPRFLTDEVSVMLYRYNYNEQNAVILGQYTDEEILDIAITKMKENFDSYNPIRYPDDYISVPSVSYIIRQNFSSITSSYTFISGEDYVNDYGGYFITLLAPEDVLIEIEVTVSLGSLTETLILEVFLKGFTPTSIDKLLENIEGTPTIALEGIALYREFGYNYFLIRNPFLFDATLKIDDGVDPSFKTFRIEAYLEDDIVHFGFFTEGPFLDKQAPSEGELIIALEAFLLALADPTLSDEDLALMVLDGTIPQTLLDLRANLQSSETTVSLNTILSSVDEQIYYLEHYSLGWFNPGEKVLIVGHKNVIDGIADYTYNIHVFSTGYEYVELTPIATDIETLYTNDYQENPLQREYLRVFGHLEFDEFIGMFTLTDGDHTIYIRTVLEDWNGESALFDYIGEEVYVNLVLPIKTIRDTYILTDFIGDHDDIAYPELTEEEQLLKAIEWLQTKYHGKDYLAGTQFDLPYWHSRDNVTFDYVLLNLDDANIVNLDNMTFNNLDTLTALTIEVTAQLGLLEETFTITLNIHPVTTTTINDALWANLGEFYEVEGIVIALGTNSYGNYSWALIEDTTGRIYLDFYSISSTLYNPDDYTLAIGDEIRVTGLRGSYDTHGVIPIFSEIYTIEVLSQDNPIHLTPTVMTFDDIFELDYLNPHTFYQYIEIQGYVYYESHYFAPYQLYTDEYSFTYYRLDIIPQDYDQYFLDFEGMTYTEITLTGFLLGYQSYHNRFDWYLLYESFEINPTD